MSRKSLLGVLFVGACASATPQPVAFAAPEGCPSVADLMPAGESGIREAVRYLADDALGGRLAGSEGERCAAAYIAYRMARAGLEPGGANAWYSEVALASVVNPHAPTGRGNNVIGVLEAGDANAPVIVIGAHYDHLGMGEFGSLSTTRAIHNGADDNASGVAALLAVAERLAADRPDANVVFIAFTGEESGLLGSARYVAEPSVPLDRMAAMINMDMVGRLRDQPLIVNGVGTAEEWTALVDEAAREVGVPITTDPDGYGPSDQTSFYSRDIPVLHLFTNVHGEYHKPEDDWQLIDFDGIERVADMVAEIVDEMEDDRLTLVRQAPPAPVAGSASRTWLGTVPDFAPVDHGVRISGVSAGSPAEAAGLQAGDIVVKLGEHEIGDLYALTDALRAYQPGDVVDVTVLRDGASITRSVTLGARQ
ncbi:MAG TPA: M20/M25/M40 family metallo-hydrolase [Longimicrobiales bacterium]